MSEVDVIIFLEQHLLMKSFLFFIPLLASILGIFIYRFQGGKRQVFKLDLVQFIYLFIISPTIYVWMKSFMYYMLSNDFNQGFSQTDIFVVDTFFSVIAFFVFVSIAIHSLTKTFRLKRDYDPHFDIFHLSEYFHLWWSHIAMSFGGMVLISFVSVVNVLFPMQIEATQLQFFSLIALGLFFGVFLFFAIWMSDPNQGNFMRIMKIFFAFFFLFHVAIYFILDPKFNLDFVLYWVVFSTFLSAVICSSFFEKNTKTNKVRDLLLHGNWGNNINVLKK